MAWLSGWNKRIEISIGDYAGDIGGAVTWFPVTVFLKDANGDSTKVFEEVTTNSRKIAVTKADGETELKGEIEQWSYDAGTPANSVAIIHASADGWVINANTSVFLYYDNDHADNANIDVINTVAGAAVWDGFFKLVCHMVDDNGNVDDSTSNNNDGTKKAAGEPAEATGKVGQGQDFDGNNDYINFGHDGSLSFANTFTMEFLVNPDSLAADIDFISKEAEYRMRYDVSDGDPLEFFIRRDDAAVDKLNTGAIATEWTYITMVLEDNVGMKTYINGGEVGSNGLHATISASVNDFFLGSHFGIERVLNGLMDEVRISSNARTAAWTKGTYNSLWDTLLTYGSEEEAPAVDNAIFFGCDF